MLQWRPLLCCCVSALRPARCCRNSRSFSGSSEETGDALLAHPEALALALPCQGRREVPVVVFKHFAHARERRPEAFFPERDAIEVDAVILPGRPAFLRNGLNEGIAFEPGRYRAPSRGFQSSADGAKSTKICPSGTSSIAVRDGARSMLNTMRCSASMGEHFSCAQHRRRPEDDHDRTCRPHPDARFRRTPPQMVARPHVSRNAPFRILNAWP